MACGLATTCRVEGRLPRLELAFGLPFFHQNLFKRMNATILVLLFSSISPGGPHVLSKRKIAKIAKNATIAKMRRIV